MEGKESLLNTKRKKANSKRCLLSSKSYQNTISRSLPKLGVVIQPYNTSTWETEAEELQFQGQPGLHSETICEITKGIAAQRKVSKVPEDKTRRR
jgi:hypothetical protein